MQKISLEFYEESFDLIALHSSLDDHVLAYTLNQQLKTRFLRSSKDLDVAQARFPYFEWEDDSKGQSWVLFANQTYAEARTQKENKPLELFENTTAQTRHYLLPEHKEVDYLVKISPKDNKGQKKYLATLLGIPKIVTAYTIEAEKIKSKNNLIL